MRKVVVFLFIRIYNMQVEELKSLLMLSRFFTYKKLLKLIKHFSGISNIIRATDRELLDINLSEKKIKLIKQYYLKSSDKLNEIDEMLDWTLVKGNKIITIFDTDYPKLLKEINDPPIVLFTKGNKNILDNLQISVVGSRNPTPIGANIAYQFSQQLASVVNLTITSGLAIGIDTMAHTGVVDIKKSTIAVIGSGLNYIYPRRNLPLSEQILSNDGMLVSEFFLNVAPLPQNFPYRNRIISGLSYGVTVVEANIYSGSLITANFAIEQGREVFAIPGSIYNQNSAGCHKLIKQGAKLTENIDDILEEFLFLKRNVVVNEKKKIVNKIKEDQYKFDNQKLSKCTNCDDNNIHLSQNKKILSHIGYETITVDDLIQRTDLTIIEIMSILLELELCGDIEKTPCGYIKKTK